MSTGFALLSLLEDVRGRRSEGEGEGKAKQKIDSQSENLHEFARKDGFACRKLHVFDTRFFPCKNRHRGEAFLLEDGKTRRCMSYRLR